MADRDGIDVLGVAGSLRQRSYNRAALRAAIELAPAGMTIETFDLTPVPLYDEDVRQRGLPAAVEELRDKMRAADALLIATPEYNHSTSGVLKNAVDWASRPPDQPFDMKPIAIMGASPGRTGTARAQSHLRQSLAVLNGFVLNRPGVLIGGAGEVFDDDLRLTDEPTREAIAKLLTALADWTRRLNRAARET